jgi:hypothetical protein
MNIAVISVTQHARLPLADELTRHLGAVLARVGDLVGDHAVLDDPFVAGRPQLPEPMLDDEVDEAADHDDRHCQHREAPGRDVVLEREHLAA